ncbi:TRAPP trafficking subunit Trs65-domain-containing protein [Tuber borchii]|uniref:TRAPP trafficking subunit Trs65-domain-containing protein n=1 Tax=Tuber borchii TaxID=42251 RepID=A0A2T6ZX29_TUBBO|nr:TRAPP trafficking subunit Trs65-domain-containing protein [Tuber borchii]
MPAAAPRKKTHARTNTVELQESARLELVVPQASDLDISRAIDEALKQDKQQVSTADGGISAVSAIEQRRSLFYDETLPVFVVLQLLIPLEDSVYESYLSRLAVSLEVAAVDGQRQQQQRQPQYGGRNVETIHLLFQTVVDENETKRIVIDNGAQRLAIWKIDVPLGHPRARLNNPKVVLTASATIRPAELHKPVVEDEYLSTRQPVGINLLESFAQDPYLSTVAPRLSASRVSRVIPVTQTPQQALRPFGYAAKCNFNIYPAINIRLRYSRIFSGTKQTIIASLDLEVTHFSECDVTIESVEIALSGGKADPLTDSPSPPLPIECRPRDDITFLFVLTPTDLLPTSSSPAPTSSNSPIRPISVTLRATAHLSSICHPKIFTNWTTTVDFSPPQSPAFQPSPGIQRAHRPPSLGSIIHGATVSSSAGIRPVHQSAAPSPALTFTPPNHSTPSFVANPAPESTPGLTITFSGPSRVYVGEVFVWTVFVVNRSQRTRKLALIVPPKRRKAGEGKSLPPRPTGGEDVTEAVLDEAVVYQTHRAQYLEPAELVPLVNDVRVG